MNSTTDLATTSALGTMAKRRCSISYVEAPAMTVARVGVKKRRLCYVIVANKLIKYPSGRSRVVYIGTTTKGITRLAQSAAQWAPEVLGTHGITSFKVHVVSCTPRQHVKTWRKLERALLLTFRDLYGTVPLCNTQGKKMREM